MKLPRTPMELRFVVVMCSVHRHFVPSYSRIAAPLNQTLKKGQLTSLPLLNDDQARAFKILVGEVISPTI